jgi:hypothetical protein
VFCGYVGSVHCIISCGNPIRSNPCSKDLASEVRLHVWILRPARPYRVRTFFDARRMLRICHRSRSQCWFDSTRPPSPHHAAARAGSTYSARVSASFMMICAKRRKSFPVKYLRKSGTAERVCAKARDTPYETLVIYNSRGHCNLFQRATIGLNRNLAKCCQCQSRFSFVSFLLRGRVFKFQNWPGKRQTKGRGTRPANFEI